MIIHKIIFNLIHYQKLKFRKNILKIINLYLRYNYQFLIIIYINY